MQFQSRDGLKVEIHADNTLNSFCKFQKNINFEKDEHPNHHDVAILLTRCIMRNMRRNMRRNMWDKERDWQTVTEYLSFRALEETDWQTVKEYLQYVYSQMKQKMTA